MDRLLTWRADDVDGVLQRDLVVWRVFREKRQRRGKRFIIDEVEWEAKITQFFRDGQSVDNGFSRSICIELCLLGRR